MERKNNSNLLQRFIVILLIVIFCLFFGEFKKGSKAPSIVSLQSGADPGYVKRGAEIQRGVAFQKNRRHQPWELMHGPQSETCYNFCKNSVKLFVLYPGSCN